MDSGSVIDLIVSSVTALGVVFAGRQLWLTRKMAGGEMAYKLYELMQSYNDVHTRLTCSGPDAYRDATPEEWARVDRYMGMFESIQILAVGTIIDTDTVDRLWGHRIAALVANPSIHDRNLVTKKARWSDFVTLWDSIKKKPFYCKAKDDCSNTLLFVGDLRIAELTGQMEQQTGRP
jgi:hypothetical protein